MSNLRRGLGLGWLAAVLASVVLTLSCGGSEPGEVEVQVVGELE